MKIVEYIDSVPQFLQGEVVAIQLPKDRHLSPGDMSTLAGLFTHGTVTPGSRRVCKHEGGGGGMGP